MLVYNQNNGIMAHCIESNLNDLIEDGWSPVVDSAYLQEDLEINNIKLKDCKFTVEVVEIERILPLFGQMINQKIDAVRILEMEFIPVKDDIKDLLNDQEEIVYAPISEVVDARSIEYLNENKIFNVKDFVDANDEVLLKAPHITSKTLSKFKDKAARLIK